jgi:outer membrane translocation and assembly module TamA
LSLGPLIIDKNVLGKQLEVRGRGGPIMNRESLTLEGSESAVSISRPLWSLDSRWGWTFDGGHSFTIERSFRGNDLRTYDAPSTSDLEAIPYLYRRRYWSSGFGVVRQLGGDHWKHRLRVSYDLTSQRPTVPDDFVGSEAARQDFIANVLPRNERTGVVYGTYELFTPMYREYRDVDSYDLAEDSRLGPRAQITVGAGLRALASDSNFGRVSLEAAWTEAWGHDGLATLAASGSARLERTEGVDRVAAVAARLMSPATRSGRVVSALRLTGVFKDASNRFLYLGGDNGLRGYSINFIDGDRRAVLQSELRSRSVRLFLGSRWGVLGFHDIGAAADVLDEMSPYQDIGIGIRALGAQLSPDVFRFDIALPLTGTHGGWPPRFTAGYLQAF